MVSVIDEDSYQVRFSGMLKLLADSVDHELAARTGPLQPGRFYWLPAQDVNQFVLQPIPSGEPPFFLALGPDQGIILGRRPLPFDATSISASCSTTPRIPCGIEPAPVSIPGPGTYAVSGHFTFIGSETEFRSVLGYTNVRPRSGYFALCESSNRRFPVPAYQCDPVGQECNLQLHIEDVVYITTTPASVSLCFTSAPLSGTALRIESGLIRVRQIGHAGF